MVRFGMVVLALLLGGCAALFNPKSSNVSFNSNPVGAEVYVDGARVGSTPYSMDLKKNKDYTVVFKMEGHSDITCQLNKSAGAGWIVLDVLGGIIPVVIDAATGSWYSLDKNACNVTLAPVAAR